jgi:hypothetical protein
MRIGVVARGTIVLGDGRMGLRPALACLLWCGCSHGLEHPRYVAQPQTALVEVDQPPPPGRVEDIPDRPTRTSAWVDGEWEWQRGRWNWRPGQWVEPPAGAAFSPWVFVRAPDGRLWYAAGVWRDPQGSPLAAPTPLASAVVDAAEVVNATGATESTGRTRPSSTATPRRP